MSKNDLALSVSGLSKKYGDRLALSPLDFEVPVGEQVALIGANGSGKTTLLRLVSGLLDPTTGDIEVFGNPRGSLNARAAVSYLPDDPVLYDDLSVSEHIQYLAPLYGAQNWEARSQALLERFGLTQRADDLPSGFSRGLRQKTSLLLGLLRPFDLLLIDEPFVGLDEVGRKALIGILDEAKEEGATVILASHQLELAKRADRALVLSEGTVAFDGSPDERDLVELTQI